jgi:hypothetical protein
MVEFVVHGEVKPALLPSTHRYHPSALTRESAKRVTKNAMLPENYFLG